MNRMVMWGMAVLSFVLLAVPFMLMDLMVSPFRTWARCSETVKIALLKDDIGKLIIQIESAQDAKAKRLEVN